jgi:predicted RNA-binding protein YlqC (UPF0109 family)
VNPHVQNRAGRKWELSVKGTAWNFEMNNPTQTDPQEALRQTIEQLLGAMTEHPEAASVRLLPSARKPTLVLSVHRVDFGAILGKHRSMLNAIKMLASIMACRYQMAVEVLLDEDGCTGQPGTRRRFAPNPEWDAATFEKLASTFCADVFGNCQVTLEPATAGTSKVTVTVLEPLPAGCEERSIEEAMAAIFNCCGVICGRRFLVEILTT